MGLATERCRFGLHLHNPLTAPLRRELEQVAHVIAIDEIGAALVLVALANVVMLCASIALGIALPYPLIPFQHERILLKLNAILQGVLVVPALSQGISLYGKKLKSDRRVGGLIEQITNVVFEYRSNLPESFIHTISPSFKLRLHPPHNPQRGFRPVSRHAENWIAR